MLLTSADLYYRSPCFPSSNHVITRGDFKTTPSSPVWDRIQKMSHKMIEKFMKELIVDQDFKVNDGGDQGSGNN